MANTLTTAASLMRAAKRCASAFPGMHRLNTNLSFLIFALCSRMHIVKQLQALELAMIGRHQEIVYALLETWEDDKLYPDSQRQGDFVVS